MAWAEVAWGSAWAAVALWVGLSCGLRGARRGLVDAAVAMAWVTLGVGLVVGLGWDGGLGDGGRADAWEAAALGVVVGLISGAMAPVWASVDRTQGAAWGPSWAVHQWSGAVVVLGVGVALWAWEGAVGVVVGQGPWRWAPTVVLGVGTGVILGACGRWMGRWMVMAVLAVILGGVWAATAWGAGVVAVFLIAGFWLRNATEQAPALWAMGRWVVMGVALIYLVALAGWWIDWRGMSQWWVWVALVVGGRMAALAGYSLWVAGGEPGGAGRRWASMVAQDGLVVVMADALWKGGGLGEVFLGVVVASAVIQGALGGVWIAVVRRRAGRSGAAVAEATPWGDDARGGRRPAGDESWLDVVVGPVRLGWEAGRQWWQRRWQPAPQPTESHSFWSELEDVAGPEGAHGARYVERGWEKEVLAGVQRGHAMVVSGDPGVGRRRLVHQVMERRGEDWRWLEAGRYGATMHLVGARGEPRGSVEEVVASMDGEGLDVVVEGASKLVWRSPQGVARAQRALQQVGRRRGGAWVWIMEEDGRRWLDGRLSLELFVDQQVALERWSRDELEAFIIDGLESSGAASLRFEQEAAVVGEHFQRWWRGQGGRWRRRVYFDRLHRLSQGRVEVALDWWRRTLGPREEGSWRVSALPPAPAVGLGWLSVELRWCLAILALHGGALTVDQVARIGELERWRCRRWLEGLVRRGLVEIFDDGAYGLRAAADGWIRDGLRREGWL